MRSNVGRAFNVNEGHVDGTNGALKELSSHFTHRNLLIPRFAEWEQGEFRNACQFASGKILGRKISG